jgi:hypothetical protein
MIRIRRVKSRIPFSRLYELEISPRDVPDATQRYVTRAPNAVLEPILGVGDAWSFVDEANRRWKIGDDGWAVELEEADSQR